MAKPDLLLVADYPAWLTAELAARFTVHRDDPPAATRALAAAGGSRVTAEMIAALPALQIIAVHGVGYDGIDLTAAAARGIVVTNTPDVLTDDVADLAIGLWLAVERRIAANDRVVRAGGWSVPLARRASGRRIGIVGLGRIGGAIARRAAPFGGELLYTARHPRADAPARYLPDIPTLAQESDVLILAAPGGEATRHIVDRAVLAALGPAGVLVNIARGSLVDQPALIAALTAGTIAGAGLDVFADEPDVPEALKALDQVVLQPHQGSATVETRRAMGELVLANLDAFLNGQPLPTPVR